MLAPGAGPPLDLTRLYGEGWCVTVVDFYAEDVLDMMGVADAVPLTAGVDLASRRLTSRQQGVLLLAKQVLPETSLVLELEGSTGWVGMDPAVLADLSEAGGTACTISRDPNKFRVVVAKDGDVVGGLDPVTGQQWGSFAWEWAEDLLSASQRAAVALHAVTGVELTLALLQDPWIGGVSP